MVPAMGETADDESVLGLCSMFAFAACTFGDEGTELMTATSVW